MEDVVSHKLCKVLMSEFKTIKPNDYEGCGRYDDINGYIPPKRTLNEPFDYMNFDVVKQCVCGVNISVNCYLRHISTGKIITIGTVCYDHMTKPKRLCRVCGDIHRNKTHKICNKCIKNHCAECYVPCISESMEHNIKFINKYGYCIDCYEIYKPEYKNQCVICKENTRISNHKLCDKHSETHCDICHRRPRKLYGYNKYKQCWPCYEKHKLKL